MRLGLIGYPLGHSWSKMIHDFFLQEDYQMFELNEEELDAFLKSKEFDGLNVTTPYKQKVMAYLDEIDEAAKEIGAVNCIVNENGILKGYNTDYLGLLWMLRRHEVQLDGRKVAILGTGGASKAAGYAVKALNGQPVFVSRAKKGESIISYEELYKTEAQFGCLINTTPVGLYPRMEETPVDLKRLPHIPQIVDIIANPLRTRLLFEAKLLNRRTLGGLEMLVAQAFEADRIFTKKQMDESRIEACLNEIYSQRRNLVLIGMPSAGKSTLAKELEKLSDRELIEMDDVIVEDIQMSIAEYFLLEGEEAFRNRESFEAYELRNSERKIISTGGGVIKREENMRNLAYNSLIVWIDRPLEYLFASSDRPLSKDMEAIRKLYEERKGLYEAYSDIQLKNDSTLEACIRQLKEYV